MQYSVDVIIPVYKPGKEIFQLIQLLEKQTYPITKIILMNTEEKYFEEVFYGTGFLEQFNNIEVHHVSKLEFDHGKTRNRGVAYSKSDIFVCMTQDAIPAGQDLIESLVNALKSEQNVAVAYAKQLPREDCRLIERYTRQFNYPDERRVKTKEDLNELGIKTFFCSNVCAAYHRNIFDMLGGFLNKTIFNEDMIFAGGAIQNGYKIIYEPGAQVVHSHNLSCVQQFKRNFDLGVSQAQHPEIFSEVSSQSEGKKLVKQTIAYLCQSHHARLLPYFIIQSGCKLTGYRLGLLYESLPDWVVKACSDNKKYFSE